MATNKPVKKLPKAQMAGGTGPGGINPGQQPNRKTPPPRGLTYTENAAPLREGDITPQQWVNTWNPKTNSYDKKLKQAVHDPKFVNRQSTISPTPSRAPFMKGGSIIKGSSARRQASIKGLRTSRKHK